MEHNLKEFAERHREAAEHLRVGERVSLFSIDEETDDESRPFTAVVEGIRDREPPQINLVVEERDGAEIRRVAEVLTDCARTPECFLHVDVRWREGAFFRLTSPNFLLKLLAPHGPEHDFVPIELGTVDQARRMNPDKYTLRFAVELLD